MKDFIQEKAAEYIPHLMVVVLALWGGTVQYINRLRKTEGAKFQLAEWMGELSISGFVGFLAMLVCLEYEVSTYMAGLISGIAGHQGARFIFLLELFVKSYIRRKTKL